MYSKCTFYNKQFLGRYYLRLVSLFRYARGSSPNNSSVRLGEWRTAALSSSVTELQVWAVWGPLVCFWVLLSNTHVHMNFYELSTPIHHTAPSRGRSCSFPRAVADWLGYGMLLPWVDRHRRRSAAPQIDHLLVASDACPHECGPAIIVFRLEEVCWRVTLLQ